MIENRRRQNNIYYILFKYLWVIILMPKYIQMIMLSIILVLLVIKNEGKIFADKIVILNTMFFAVNLFSILVNLPMVTSYNRFFAAFNTSVLWLYAGFFYTYYQKSNLDIERVEKYMATNMLIFIILGVYMICCKLFNISAINILSRNLYRTDWLNSTKTIRFKGYMEYSNLGVFFYMICFPLFYSNLNKMKSNVKKTFLILISIISPILTNSRMGIFAVLIVSYIGFLNLNLSKNKKIKQLFSILIILCTIIFIIINFKFIYYKVFNIINSRGASTSTRINIYINSIYYTLKKSIIYGCGIKEMIGKYPLGSHSTYIGIFYKTGMLGLIIFIISFTTMIKTLYKFCIQRKNVLICFVPIFLVCLMLVLEDLDGSNWLIILFYSQIGILTNSRMQGGIINAKAKEND